MPCNTQNDRFVTQTDTSRHKLTQAGTRDRHKRQTHRQKDRETRKRQHGHEGGRRDSEAREGDKRTAVKVVRLIVFLFCFRDKSLYTAETRKSVK